MQQRKRDGDRSTGLRPGRPDLGDRVPGSLEAKNAQVNDKETKDVDGGVLPSVDRGTSEQRGTPSTGQLAKLTPDYARSPRPRHVTVSPTRGRPARTLTGQGCNSLLDDGRSRSRGPRAGVAARPAVTEPRRPHPARRHVRQADVALHSFTRKHRPLQRHGPDVLQRARLVRSVLPRATRRERHHGHRPSTIRGPLDQPATNRLRPPRRTPHAERARRHHPADLRDARSRSKPTGDRGRHRREALHDRVDPAEPGLPRRDPRRPRRLAPRHPRSDHHNRAVRRRTPRTHPRHQTRRDLMSGRIVCGICHGKQSIQSNGQGQQHAAGGTGARAANSPHDPTRGSWTQPCTPSACSTTKNCRTQSAAT